MTKGSTRTIAVQKTQRAAREAGAGEEGGVSRKHKRTLIEQLLGLTLWKIVLRSIVLENVAGESNKTK